MVVVGRPRLARRLARGSMAMSVEWVKGSLYAVRGQPEATLPGLVPLS
jgi:hypothetical protein